jgi:RHS repeat-associated protein
MQSKYLSLLLLLAASLGAGAQNIPQLTETAPSGTASEISLPALPYFWTGINHTLTTAPMLPVTDASAIDALGADKLKQSYTFTDGFNRVFETVQSNVSKRSDGTLQHLVQFSDTRFQRDQYSFLPYTSPYFGLNNYVYQTQKDYYNSLYPGEGYTSYGKSASTGLNSMISYAPGKSQIGQGRGTTSRKITNAGGEVRFWDIDGSGNPVSTGTYTANELFGEEVIAPNALGNNNFTAPSSRVFTDKDGHVILKMVADSSYTYGSGVPQAVTVYQSTYYVYDDMGRLRYTLPPRAMPLIETAGWTVSATVLNNLCFQYRYDDKNRLRQQRFPGEKDFTAMVYDHKQRVVMLQTPKDKAQNQYQLSYYDKLNRVIATALYTNYSSPPEWQLTFDYPPTTSYLADDIRHYMGFNKEGVIPAETIVPGQVLLSSNYYDNYDVTDPGSSNFTSFNSQLNFTELQANAGSETPQRSLRIHGQLTGSKIKILSSPNASLFNTGAWTWLSNYYDDKGRVINALQRDFHTNGVQIHFKYGGIQYDFLNRPLISKSIFQNLYATATIYTELSKNEYQSGTGALTKTSHKVQNGNWTTQSIMSYDSLGRLKRKVLGNYGEVQDFSYNMRGQLTGINGIYAETGNKQNESRSFGESLKYDYGFNQKEYNGKIAGMIWRGSSSSAGPSAYGYSYDQSGRLKHAEYRNFSASTWNKTALDYTVSYINYDKNGNLLSMDQQGNVPGSGIQTIDQLRYNYEDNGQSNRLLKVGDAMPDYGTGDFVNTNGTADDYSYDANGNLASDANKEIDTIIYTHFDKPQEIRFKNGKSLEYSYDAAGGKVQELVRQPGQADKITDYIGSYVYENNSLQYIPTAEGRSVRTTVNDNFKEEYFVKDHLGNVRSTIDVTPTPLQVYLATYELASANLEGLLFEQVAEIREDNPSGTDTGNLKSGKLNGADQRIGTSLLMHVMAGDEVELNVNTFYEGYDAQNDNPVSAANMLSSIIGTLTGGVGGFQGSEGHNTAMVQQLFTPENYVGVYDNITGGITDPDRPKAYLNYVLFDENMAINATFSSAFQARGNGSWEEIGTTAPIKIPANGYLAVYLSNRSQVTGCTGCGNVYFDQLQVRIQNGRLLEESHYYPFGLPMAGLSTETGSNTIRQRRKYQSNEYIKELGLNWMDFNARQYDPQLGRFLGVDPLAASGGQDMFSPYAAMGNAPESMVDPNGTLATYSSDGVRNDELSTYAKDYVAEGGERGTGNFGNGNGGWSDRIWGGGMSQVMANAAAVAEKAKNDAEKTTGESKTQGDGKTVSNLGSNAKDADPKKDKSNNNNSASNEVYSIKEIEEATKNGVPTPEFYLENNSEEDYYVKPESNGKAILVGPGYVFIGRIDGFATKETGVYKVPDFTKVTVAKEGYLIFKRSMLIRIIHDVLDKNVERLDKNWLQDRHNNNDKGWDNLFNSIR